MKFPTRKPKPQRTQAYIVDLERRQHLFDYIQEKGRVSINHIQVHFEWGPGVMERIKRELLAVHPEVKFDKKTREFYLVDQKPKKSLCNPQRMLSAYLELSNKMMWF